MSNNKLLALLFCVCFSISAHAQLKINSPYSRFGLGDLHHPVSAFNIGMGGVGVSLTSSKDINTLNPALLYRTKYTSFEVGGTYSVLSANENGANSLTSNFGFDYFNMAFVISKSCLLYTSDAADE